MVAESVVACVRNIKVIENNLGVSNTINIT